MKRFLLTLFALATILTVKAQNLSDSLVAYYTFNGNADDVVGGHHGTKHNTTLVADKFGNINSAYAFNGIDSYIDLPDSTIGNWGQISYSVWVYAPKYTGSGWPGFIGATTSKDYWNINLGIYQATQHLHFEVTTDQGNFGGEGKLSIPWNTWFNAVMVYDGDSLTEYINGVRGKSFPVTGKLATVTDLTIGQASSNYHFFKGQLDEVRIYKKALSASDIAALYHNFVTSIKPEVLPATIGLFPNPAADNLHISLPDAGNARFIAVYNMLGEKVLYQSFSNVVDISGLRSGTYYVSVLDNNGAPIGSSLFVRQ